MSSLSIVQYIMKIYVSPKYEFILVWGITSFKFMTQARESQSWVFQNLTFLRTIDLAWQDFKTIIQIINFWMNRLRKWFFLTSPYMNVYVFCIELGRVAAFPPIHRSLEIKKLSFWPSSDLFWAPVRPGSCGQVASASSWPPRWPPKLPRFDPFVLFVSWLNPQSRNCPLHTSLFVFILFQNSLDK